MAERDVSPDGWHLLFRGRRRAPVDTAPSYWQSVRKSWGKGFQIVGLVWAGRCFCGP